MAKDRQPVRAEAKGTVRVSGRFFPQGSGAATIVAGSNVGWTVARSGVGTFLLTFTEKYPSIVSMGALTVQLSALADTDAQWGSVTQATATAPTTIAIAVKTAGVAADISGGGNNSINFDITFAEVASIK